MTSRVVVVAVLRKVQTRKVQGQERAKVNDKARTETFMAERQDTGRRVDESSWHEASINKTVIEVWISRSRIWKMSKESRAQKLHGTRHEFHSVVFGFRRDEQYQCHGRGFQL